MKFTPKIKKFVNEETGSAFSVEDIGRMLDSVESVEDKLSEWEYDFIDSIRHQFDKTESLSQKQIVILERIYSEKTN